MRRKSLGYVLVVVILGALIGSALGEVLAMLLPHGVVKEFFLRSANFSVGPAVLDLILFTVTLGFSLKLNVIGVLGIVMAAYILRWFD